MPKNTSPDAPAHESARLERLAAVGQLAGGIAHDFSNLVTAIAFHADYLLARLSDEPALHERASQIREAARRAGSLTNQLLAVSRRRAVEPRRIDPNASIHGLRSLFHHFLGDDVEIVLDLDDGAGHVSIDPSQFEQVILNLAVNARDAIPRGGTLRIASAALELADATDGVEPGAWVELTVGDRGTDLESGPRDRRFEPLYTARDAGSGSGLGLSTVARVVRDAGGEAQVEKAQVEKARARGTTFRVLLPRLDAEAPSRPDVSVAAREDESVATSERDSTRTVLVVEDEDELRRLMVEVLEEMGYRVLAAGSGEEAQRRVAEVGSDAIDLLLVDLVMPDVRGPELVAKLRRMLGDLPIVYMSGYMDSADAEELREMADARFIEKPFDGLTLAHTVRGALEAKGG